MAEDLRPIGAIEARLARKLNNALTLTFRNGPDEPIGVAVQSAADGVGRKLGVLFGFKNGGTGVHVYTPATGPVLHVESKTEEPTVLTRPDGSVLGTIERSTKSIGRDAQGRPVLHWIDHPGETENKDAYRLDVTDPAGTLVAHLNVILTNRGWSLGRDLLDEALWFGQAGQSLPLPNLGTSVQLFRELTPVEHEFLIASCIDIAISLRGYGSG
jgi:hypothetical protein